MEMTEDMNVAMTPQEEVLQEFRSILLRMGNEAGFIRDMESCLVSILAKYNIERKPESIIVYDNGDAEIIAKYFVAKAVQGCTQGTMKTYKDVITKTLSVIGKHLRDITSDDLRIYLAKKKIEGGSSAYLAIIYRSLNSLFNWCRKEGYVRFNPLDKVERIKVRSKPEEALTEEQLELVRSEAGSLRNKAFIEMLYSTGCRISELCALNRDDIDWENMEVQVLGKGRKYRTVYITQRAKYAYLAYLKVRTDKSPALFGYEPEPRCGTDQPKKLAEASGWEYDPDKGRLEPGVADGLLRAIGKRCGFRLHPHLLRKTVATHALRKGMSIDEVRIMLGHDSIATTTIYAQTLKDDVKDSHTRYVG